MVCEREGLFDSQYERAHPTMVGEIMVAEAYDRSHCIYDRMQREVNVGAQLAFFPHLSFPRIPSSLYVHYRK